MKLLIAAFTAVIALALSGPVDAGVRPRPHTAQYAGQVTTVAGTFSSAAAVTFDPDHQVFYVFSAGKIDQVTLVGGVTSLCRFNIQAAGGLTYDSSNQRIYATDTQGYAVQSISLGCQVSFLAGGTYGTSDGQGSAAQFQAPTGITLDPSHQVLYVADVDRIRAITVGGSVTTFTAPGSIGEIGRFGYQPWPIGLAFDAAHGLVYVADPTRNMVETVNARGRVQSVAGRCVSLISGCDPMQIDGARIRAGFASPAGVALNPSDGSLYVVEGDNNDVRRISGNTVGTLAGNGNFGNADGVGILASFYGPQSLAIDPVSGILLVADGGNRLLRMITTQGAAPPPPPHGTITYDPPTYLSGPNSIAVAPDGTVWFTEATAARIGRRTSDGHIREFVLPRLRAQPGNIVIGSDGAVWFTDTGVYRGSRAAIGRLSANGAITEYPIGNSFPSFIGQLSDLTMGPDGNLWFTDANDNIFGSITPLGQITQLPGTFSFIVSGFDGNLWTAQANMIYRLTTGGTLLNSYQVINGFGGITSFANGNNQAVWFVYDPGIPEVGFIGIDGKLRVAFIPHDRDCLPYGGTIAQGSDGNEWYLWGEDGCNAQHSAEFGSVTPDGKTTTLYPIYEARVGPTSITFAPDGTLWFADPYANKIGKQY